MSFRKKLVLLSIAFSGYALPAISHAAVIIEDHFTLGTAGGTTMNGFTDTPNAGKAPDTTNLPGSKWISTGQDDYDTREFTGGTASGTVVNYSGARNNNASGIALSSGTYTAPNDIVITGSLNPSGVNTFTGTPYTVLGLYSKGTASNGQYSNTYQTNFIGIGISTAGNVVLNNHGTLTNLGTTTFNSNGFAKVTFEAAAVTGGVQISNISVNSNAIAGSYTALTSDATPFAYAGFGSGNNGYPSGGILADFSVSSVPEPSSVALLSLIVYPLCRRQRVG